MLVLLSLVVAAQVPGTPPASPPNPPLPPLVPGPDGFITVTNAAQLRSAIAATPLLGSVNIYLPLDSVLSLEGSPISIGAIDLYVYSEGATLDAQEASRILDVQSGARLRLHGITLANGRATEGGLMVVQIGVSLSFTRCLLTSNQATTVSSDAHVSCLLPRTHRCVYRLYCCSKQYLPTMFSVWRDHLLNLQ